MDDYKDVDKRNENAYLGIFISFVLYKNIWIRVNTTLALPALSASN